MRSQPGKGVVRQPAFANEAHQLNTYLKTLSVEQLVQTMHLSPALAQKTQLLIKKWGNEPADQTPAIDSFIGDIYSGLRAGEFSDSERTYADATLGILSGLYGLLRPLDGIMPYRLEMGYRFPDPQIKSMYDFWGERIAAQLPTGLIVNASSAEYMRAITPYVGARQVVTPNFLTVDPNTSVPTFRAVHAKIARGAFARWLITTRTADPKEFPHFDDLGYHYDETLSQHNQPTFICQEFGGKGLSIRLG